MKTFLLAGAALALALPARAQPVPDPTEAGPATDPASPQTPVGERPATPEPSAPAAPAPAPPPPSTSATVNLIRALVARGALTAADGEALLQQAEAEAASARVAASPAGTVRIPYVPETVRQQIRDELRADVLQAARVEGWAQPGQVAEWTRGITISGDFRFRNQFNLFDDGNSNQLVDYALLNAAGPIELNPSQPGSIGLPLLNSREDRSNRLSFRARLGVNARVSEAVELGLRLASGADSGPVSTSQLLGGGFGKKDIWLDQAYVRLRPIPQAVATAGRFANPFYSTDIIWDYDLNFDGVHLGADTGDLFGGFKLGAVAGIFPFEYSSDNVRSFAAPTPQGVDQSRDRGEQNKWLYGGQIIADWRASAMIGVKAGVAYYSFDGVRGAVSEPCELFGGNFECSTDPLRPAFQQKGNTLFALRDIVANPASPLNFALPQFFGLAFDYDMLNLTADVDVRLNDRLHLIVGGDYVQNLGLDEGDICRAYANPRPGLPATDILRPAANNVVGADCAAGVDYDGGDTGWMARATIGHPDPRRLGEWNVFVAYKYLESDAVLDGLTDNDFHLGGTNAEGYIVAGTLGLYDNFSARARWFSANEVSGPPLAIDVLQIDLLVSF